MKIVKCKIIEPVWPKEANIPKRKLVCTGDFDKKPKPNDYICIYDMHNDELLIYYIHNVFKEGEEWIISVGKTERSSALMDCNMGKRKISFLYNPDFNANKRNLKIA